MSAPEAVTRRAEELRASIYARHGAGCCWHCTLDDGNVKNIDYDVAHVDRAHADCVELAPLMVAMSQTQRRKLAAGGYRRKA